MTPSELHVARLAAQGLSNASIARLRRTSPRTVANQIARVLRELRLPSRRALAARIEVPLEPRVVRDAAWLSLSARQRQVVTHAARGTPLKLVAIDLALSPSTVSSTLRVALARLGLVSAAEMIRAFASRTAGAASVAGPGSQGRP